MQFVVLFQQFRLSRTGILLASQCPLKPRLSWSKCYHYFYAKKGNYQWVFKKRFHCFTLQYAAACSLGSAMRRPPDVSAEDPCNSWNIFPQAFATPAILAIIGRLWMTKETSFFWLLAKFCAWPNIPNPEDGNID